MKTPQKILLGAAILVALYYTGLLFPLLGLLGAFLSVFAGLIEYAG